MRDMSCDYKNFAIGIEDLFSDVDKNVEAQINEEVPKAGRKAVKKVKEHARSQGWSGKTGSKYVAGFHSTTVKDGSRVSSEIGNSNVPGLVHLLEKGHNTIGGRRVAGKPHMEPAFNEVSEEFFDNITKAVGEALEA